ncbi:MAG: peptide chain release factor N(5)-glutamine methyltransferase [Bacteroidia bacterium]|nr:peptide chain release factor N(5)-glutamine methyltransferase [Bacteroidia bacterium]
MGSRPVTLATLRQETLSALLSLYSPEEASSLVRRLFHHFFPEWEKQWLLSRGEKEVPSSLLPLWKEAVHRLLAREPLAYVLGKTQFLSLELLIQPGVFIPRPETEEWAIWVAEQIRTSPPRNILDIGTGSGALAIFMKKTFPSSDVYAIDKSSLALHIAEKNAEKNEARIHLSKIDFGKEPFPSTWPAEWDLILSNPPYIPWSAYVETAPEVRLYEPPEALFCEGLSPTIDILRFCKENLAPAGMGVVEIFPSHALALQKACGEIGISLVTVYRDSWDRERWLVYDKRRMPSVR